MRGRSFFLAAFLAFAGSSAILLFFDTREATWQDYAPQAAQLDAAYPVDDQWWILQFVVRSNLALPYTRALAWNQESDARIPLGTFAQQLYPMGFRNGVLWFFAETYYVPSLRGSQILERLSAPAEIDGELLAWESGSLRRKAGLAVRDSGIPFFCAGAMRTGSYGSSDTSYYTVLDTGLEEWFSVPHDTTELPFCAADGTVYLTAGDDHFEVQPDSRISQKVNGRLWSRFALDGSWLVRPAPDGCHLYGPDPQDQFPGANTQTAYKLATGKTCPHSYFQGAELSGWTVEWESTLTAREDNTTVHGKLVGMRGDTALVTREGEMVVVTWDTADGFLEHVIPMQEWFSVFPALPDEGTEVGNGT